MLIGDREVVHGLVREQLTGPVVYDLKLLYEGASLDQLAQSVLPAEELWTYQADRKRIRAIIRSARVAKVDLDTVNASLLMPQDLFQRHDGSVAMVTRMAWEKVIQRGPEALQRYENETLPFARALLRMGLNGVKVDRERCMELLKDEASLAVGKHVLRSMLDLSKIDGFAHTKYSMFGGKTGRVKVDGGLDTMTIPHGRCRSCVRSRFKDGRIYTIDFNAIDFRSIVSSVPEVGPLYEGCSDFHERTRELLELGDLERQSLKHLTYVYLYGGSMETMQQKTRLSVADIEQILGRFDRKLAPLQEFRRKLHAKGVGNGYVELPNGRRVRVDADDHPGKVLGLYAQTYSSWIFERAVLVTDGYIERQRKNGHRLVTCFPVHDELVIDAPEEDDAVVRWLSDEIEDATGFKVKVKSGKDYSEATD